jgi:hypothetical protein
MAPFRQGYAIEHPGIGKYQAAVREFAGWVGLDAPALIEGQAFEIGGVSLRLLHYGVSDPYGATVVVDYGEFGAENEAIILRRLLEHNLQTPAGRLGYFSLAPGLRRMLYCIRVELEWAEDGADAIANVVGFTVESIRALCFSILQQSSK